MKTYLAQANATSSRKIIVGDMLLTKDMPTTAGSKMLEGYVSLFEAEVITKLKSAGYEISGKANVGEFAFDVLGETSYFSPCVKEGVLVGASAEAVNNGEALASIDLDVNGAPRRASAQSGLVSIKPTYGTVSRYGTIPVACSGETVSVTAKSSALCREILGAISGHDDKDGTSLSEEIIRSAKASDGKVSRVAILSSMLKGTDEGVKAKINAFSEALKKAGVTVDVIDDEIIPLSRIAWNVLMSAELCNNVSRYDGVKYGYRAESFTGIDELYTNSRTEAFGDLLKTAILFGSETLSTENYMKVYDKALRTRRVIVEEFAKLFESYDALILPACSKMGYTEKEFSENKDMAFVENFYTAPASISGLPAMTVGGVQIIAKAFEENKLFYLSDLFEKEGK